MELRKLMKADADLMLEWMHDEDVVQWMKSDFASKTITDCERFIEKSQKCSSDLNLAVVDELNEYMGTVSLKHINRDNKTAEFAITMRKKAMGRGFSQYGMAEILKIGLCELGLEKIFWCVSIENKRAIRFYEKSNTERTTDVPIEILDNYNIEQQKKMIWYVMKK